MLLAILPNWDSLDSVRNAHSDLELAGLVFFALLVIAEAAAHNSKQEKRKHLFDSIGIWFFAIAVSCEIAAYRYGQRNDALSEQVISSLDVKSRNADTKAQAALEKSSTADAKAGEALTKSIAANEGAGKAQDKIVAVGKRAEEIDADLARTQYLLSGRSITNFDSLVRRLGQYRNRPVYVGSTNDIEQNLLCAALYKAAHDAEMDAENECGRLVQVGMMPTGVMISGPNQQETLDIAQILLHTSDLGPGGTQAGTLSPGLRIIVGAKPPFMATQARGVKVPTKKKLKKKTNP